MEKVPEYCLLWIQSSLTCMPRSDWASWVQAGGSLLGIAVAIGAAWYQSNRSTKAAATAIKHSEALLQAQRVDRIRELFAAPTAIALEIRRLGTRLHHHVMEVLQENVERFDSERMVSELKFLVEQLNEIKPHTMPTGAGVRLMMHIQSASNGLMNQAGVIEVDRVRMLRNSAVYRPPGELIRAMDRILDPLRAAIKEFQAEADRAAQPVGVD